MDEFLNSFSNREISLIIWSVLGIVILLILGKNSISNIIDLMKNLFSRFFIPFYILFALYFYLIINSIKSLNLWETALYKDFIFWFITSGLVIFFNSSKLDDYGDFKKIILKLFSINIIAEFIIGFNNFSLITELILIPVLVFLSLLYGFAEHHKEKYGYHSVVKLLNTGFGLFGITIFFYSAFKIFKSYDQFFTISNLKSFLISPFFTLIFLPIIYFAVVYMQYEKIIINLNRYRFISEKRKKRIKKSILIYANIGLKKLKIVDKVILRNKKELQDEEDIREYLKFKIRNP